MACNGKNHPDWCECDFRGGHPNSGWFQAENPVGTARYGALRDGSPRIRSSLWPHGADVARSTYCRDCFYEPVWFVRHNGGCVLLDALGWPWPKHECANVNFLPSIVVWPPEVLGKPKPLNRATLGIIIQIIPFGPLHWVVTVATNSGSRDAIVRMDADSHVLVGAVVAVTATQIRINTQNNPVYAFWVPLWDPGATSQLPCRSGDFVWVVDPNRGGPFFARTLRLRTGNQVTLRRTNGGLTSAMERNTRLWRRDPTSPSNNNEIRRVEPPARWTERSSIQAFQAILKSLHRACAPPHLRDSCFVEMISTPMEDSVELMLNGCGMVFLETVSSTSNMLSVGAVRGYGPDSQQVGPRRARYDPTEICKHLIYMHDQITTVRMQKPEKARLLRDIRSILAGAPTTLESRPVPTPESTARVPIKVKPKSPNQSSIETYAIEPDRITTRGPERKVEPNLGFGRVQHFRQNSSRPKSEAAERGRMRLDAPTVGDVLTPTVGEFAGQKAKITAIRGKIATVMIRHGQTTSFYDVPMEDFLRR